MLFGWLALACLLCSAVCSLGVRLRRRPEYRHAWPAALALAAALGAWSGLVPLPGGFHLAFVPVLAAWAVAVVIDARTKVLPDLLTVGAALWLGCVLPWLPHGRRAMLAGLATAAVFFLLGVLSPRSFGLGDVKLGLTTGALAGWFGWWPVLLSAALAFLGLSLAGGLVALVGRRRLREIELPFGPFLVAAALASPWLLPPGRPAGPDTLPGAAPVWLGGALTFFALMGILGLLTRPPLKGTLTLHGLSSDREVLLTGRTLRFETQDFAGVVRSAKTRDEIRVDGTSSGGPRRKLTLRDGHTRRLSGQPMTYTAGDTRIAQRLDRSSVRAGGGTGGRGGSAGSS